MYQVELNVASGSQTEGAQNINNKILNRLPVFL